jgi:XTP/dITP diphosphohydrolase
VRISTVLVATRNPGKLREFRALLVPAGWPVLGLDALAEPVTEPAEEGATFADNARVKALAVSEATELAVLADDSGLEVAALGGRPGVYSARYAGARATDADRIAKLLEELGAKRDRRARFVCALALAQRGALLAEALGECQGEIGEQPRGSCGFGYDPVFLVPELGRTFAELSEAEKNLRSHRARAVRDLLDRLAAQR